MAKFVNQCHELVHVLSTRGECTVAQLAAAMHTDRHTANKAAIRAAEKDYAVRINPGEYGARYAVTQMGQNALTDTSAFQRQRKHRSHKRRRPEVPLTTDQIVARAMRRQPISPFHAGTPTLGAFA